MKSSCYLVLNRSVLPFPNLHSIFTIHQGHAPFSYLYSQLLNPPGLSTKNSALHSAHIKASNHTLSLHRPTSTWLSPYLLVSVLPLLFVTCNCFTYVAERRTCTYSKYISRDRYPASLLVRRWDLQKTHITWPPTSTWRHGGHGKQSLLYCRVRIFRAWPTDNVILLRVGTCLLSCGLAMGIHVTMLIYMNYLA
jgi:hypothetical protein